MIIIFRWIYHYYQLSARALRLRNCAYYIAAPEWGISIWNSLAHLARTVELSQTKQYSNFRNQRTGRSVFAISENFCSLVIILLEQTADFKRRRSALLY